MTAPPRTTSMALVCIDMQNDFALPGAPLCVAGAMACLPKVQEAIAMARQRGIPVIWVVREHDCYGVDVERTRAHLFNGPGTGATIAGTDGAKLVQGLEVMEGERVVIKRRFSAFFQTPLDSILRRLRVEKLVLCGIQTPNCIRTAAYDGLCLDYDVLVLSDATASKTPEVQEANLQDMRDAGIGILTVEEWAAMAKDHA